jgi:DNA polymerase-3 subunit beta
MKFIISASTFQKQLSAINGVVPSNPIVPILENFLLEINSGILTISASDLQISMVTKIDVETQENGKLAVPAKLLLDSLKSLPDQPLTCIMDENTQTFEVTHYKGKFKLSCSEAEDFPKIPAAQDNNKNIISSQILLEAIGRTIFAVGNDEIKPAMTGVLFVFKPNFFVLQRTPAEQAFYTANKDSFGNAVQYLDANGDGKLDVRLITATG